MPPSLRGAKRRSNLPAIGPRRHCERSEATCWLMGRAVIASAAKQPPLIRVFIKSNMNVNNSSGTKVFCLSPAAKHICPWGIQANRATKSRIKLLPFSFRRRGRGMRCVGEQERAIQGRHASETRAIEERAIQGRHASETRAISKTEPP